MPANILIVDDTPVNLTVLRDILAQAGYRVRAALNGEMALKIIRREPADLVLLDIVMPGMSGYETCEHLKADPQTADCPVLFISALDTVADKLRGFQAGALDYITKPFQVDEVLARVRTHLALHQAQRALRHQNAALEAAARLREDVDRMLRHDMRGPLGNVIAFSDLLRREVGDSNPLAAEHAQVIAQAAYAVLSMVHSSFDLLKMERGDYQAQQESFDLGELLRQVAHEMRPMADRKSVRLELAADGETNALGERLLSRSMFYNLLRNAIEASPREQAVSMRVTLRADAGRLEVLIRNGGEVPLAIREHFFEKYVTSGKADGNGLGTYSARLMAHVQGGAILLDCSEPGFTSVLVRLPADLATGKPEAAPVAPARPVQHLLIADDDPAIHAYLRQVLPAGLTTEHVHDGDAALHRLTTASFDAALIDMQMPGLSGLGVARGLMAHRRQADDSGTASGASSGASSGTSSGASSTCRLIALTGHADPVLQRECLSAGFDHVLTKPPSLPHLLRLLGSTNGAGEAAPVLQMDAALEPLMADFLASRKLEFERMEEALTQQDAQRVASIAHKLQGSFAMYGFAASSQLAISIEKAAAKDLRQAATLLNDLKCHLDEVRIHYC